VGASLSGLGNILGDVVKLRQNAALLKLRQDSEAQNSIPSDIRAMDIVGMERTPQNLLNLRTAGSTGVQYTPEGKKQVSYAPTIFKENPEEKVFNSKVDTYQQQGFSETEAQEKALKDIKTLGKGRR